MSKFVITGFSDEISPDLGAQIEGLRKLGIGHMEIRGVNGKPVVSYGIDDVRLFKRRLDDGGVKVSALGSPVGKQPIEEPFAPHRELFKRCLDVAEALDTPYIRVFSFFVPAGEEERDRWRGEVLERTGELVRLAEARGVVLLHENEDDVYGNTPQRCMDLMNAIGSRCFMSVIDPGNFVKAGVTDSLAAYAAMKSRIVYVHAKDATPGEEHFLPVGEGKGMVRELLAALHRDGYEGFASVEPHLKYLPVSGEQQFTIACRALRKLLLEVTGQTY